MFSVPGWSVSAENLVAEKATSKEGGLQTGEGLSEEKNRKRKKGRHSQKKEVKVEDLERAWKKQFEGNNVGENEKRKRRKRKRTAGREKDGSEPAAEADINGRGEQLPGTTSLKESSRGNDRKTGKSTRAEIEAPATTNGISRAFKPYGSSSADPKRRWQIQQTENEEHSTKLSGTAPGPNPPNSNSNLPILPPQPPPTTNLTPLQSHMRAKLLSARFRHLNETLYTSPSSAALSLFASDPSLFSEYHAGFSQQVRGSWPQNPANTYIDVIQRRAQTRRSDDAKGRNAKGREKRGKGGGGDVEQLPLPRRPNGTCTVADLGCGDASLARALGPVSEQLGLRIHSYDLHASNQHVTQADIANLPVRDGQVDITIFCLSLMGTNWIEFVEEAWRILRGDGKGECWVAEVKSRFGRPKAQVGAGATKGSQDAKSKKQKAKGKRGGGTAEDDSDRLPDEDIFAEDAPPPQPGADATDIVPFVRIFERRGFVLRPESVQRDNKMFIAMVFVKSGVPRRGKWSGMKWSGSGRYERVDVTVGDDEDGGRGDGRAAVEEEGRVLKPCVYKVR